MRRRRDEGIIQVFEAIAIGLVLILVFYYTLTFDSPSAGPSQARLTLQDELYDAVDAISETRYTEPRYAGRLLSKAAAEGARGNLSLIHI